jgi:hypothetical protein
MALGFSGGGRVEAESLDVISGCKDPESSCFMLMMDRTYFQYDKYVAFAGAMGAEW